MGTTNTEELLASLILLRELQSFVPSGGAVSHLETMREAAKLKATAAIQGPLERYLGKPEQHAAP
ncbi:hypothetical protein FJV41_48290 [Myxococcus llanfairpwllgwyngyllgogerychwyrndrobwllllantysiliogogogochensis]|uniref:Uncharacterized protein n=1 Tax=Myxococcus llanfairpwllgwyngyllgogerychwyrndrobwllllantysiliogogogochensis TaxID=2590453 RepID=A0A540WI93_9BACT|nr:hypothetical protein [Myxococcus llanfairpwllgwyngyllgogerychwyrndrobwllllantysiliogogogochensis]TQF08745.1 hypothetical protein FJV41_48290 [Myxococcus llanfairpwllgwyngyllgogerychwyrndrobwllllantysiliogogogochensis]